MGFVVTKVALDQSCACVCVYMCVCVCVYFSTPLQDVTGVARASSHAYILRG